MPTLTPRLLFTLPRGIILFLALAALRGESGAKDKVSDKISLDGYVATTITSVYKALSPSVYYHAKLELEYEVNKRVEAQIQVRGRSDETDRLRFREANVRIKLDDDAKIKVGYVRKPIGEEEQVSEEDLPTIDQSYVYSVLGPMNYIGRDIGVQYVRESKDDGLDLHLGAYLNTSNTSGGSLRVAWQGLLPSLTIAASGVFQNRRLDDGVAITAGLVHVSGAVKHDLFTWIVEGFAAVDPFASRFLQLESGSVSSRIWLVAARTGATLFFPFGEDRQGLEPVLTGGFLVPDSRSFDAYTLDLLAGVNYYMNEDTRLRLNVRPLLTTPGSGLGFSRAGSFFSLEFQARW